MKKTILFFLAGVLMLCTASCGNSNTASVHLEPKTSQMKAICELAVMDCYYHNVAKFEEENAEGILWWQKDKHFWIEYSGVVTLGIDASLVSVDVKDTEVTITIPQATVLTCTVDSASLSEDSFIVEQGSAKVDADDEIVAFAAAQAQLKENASSDTALLASAQQRAQTMLEDYITNIGNAVGKEYSIKWVYLNTEETETEASPAPSATGTLEPTPTPN